MVPIGISEVERAVDGNPAAKRVIIPTPELQLRAQQALERRRRERAEYFSNRSFNVELGRTMQPRTKAEWRNWIEECLGWRFTLGELRFAEESLTSDAEYPHLVPLDWTWEMYCLACGRSSDGEWRQLTKKEISQAVKTWVLHGPRSGAKTLGLAIVIFSLLWWMDGYTWTHAAAELSQAQKVLEYMKDNWCKSAIFEHFVVKANNNLVKLGNGSYCQIVTGSFGGLNSPHTLTVSFDEVELMEQDVIDQGLMIPQAQAGRNLPSLVIFASTLKRANRTMSVKIEQAKKGLKSRYVLWDIWDVIERCEEWRREDLPGGIDCTAYDRLQAEVSMHSATPMAGMSIKQMLYLDDLKEAVEALHHNCNLIADCRGKAIQGAGHWSIDVARDDWENIARETIKAELLCQKPSMRGAVYDQYDAEGGNEDMRAVWQRPNPPKIQNIGCADYGFSTDPAAANLLCCHGPFVDVFHEVHEHNWDSDRQAKHYKVLSIRYKIGFWIVDQSAKELINKMRKLGLVVITSSKKVSPGIENLRSLVKSATGFRHLRINPVACPFLCAEIGAYILGPDGKPKSNQQDHHLDALRYAARWMYLNRTVAKSPLQRGGYTTGRSPAGGIANYYARQYQQPNLGRAVPSFRTVRPAAQN